MNHWKAWNITCPRFNCEAPTNLPVIAHLKDDRCSRDKVWSTTSGHTDQPKNSLSNFYLSSSIFDLWTWSAIFYLLCSMFSFLSSNFDLLLYIFYLLVSKFDLLSSIFHLLSSLFIFYPLYVSFLYYIVCLLSSFFYLLSSNFISDFYPLSFMCYLLSSLFHLQSSDL